MFEWQRQTIVNLKNHLMDEPDCLALIVVGSVARGEAGETSDIDLLLVVTEQEYTRRAASRTLIYEADAFCPQEIIPSEGGHAGGYLIDLPYLREAADHGDERTRFQFLDAMVVFSRHLHIEPLVRQIAVYPENERLEKMKSFYSQLPLHFSFMELAEYSQNAYLLSETAVALVLFGGRLILAYNHMLYPNRKWFLRELARAPLKPEGMLELAERLLRQPGIQAAQAFCECIYSYTNWPQPEEGTWGRIHQDSVWNWRSGSVSLAER